MTDARPGIAARDLDAYTVRYERLPFEPLQAAVRRRRMLDAVARVGPARLLEVGCGVLPLFTDLPGIACTVVEPADAFAQGARALGRERDDVRVVHGPLEALQEPAGGYDMIVLASLLHEVRDALADELARAGFTVVEEGSLLVKPFTHAQMQQLVDAGFLTPALLDGLDRLSDDLPALGSELWMHATVRP